MTHHDLARTLEAVANQLQVVAGLAAQKLVELEGAVDRVVRRLKGVPPTHAENA